MPKRILIRAFFAATVMITSQAFAVTPYIKCVDEGEKPASATFQKVVPELVEKFIPNVLSIAGNYINVTVTGDAMFGLLDHPEKMKSVTLTFADYMCEWSKEEYKCDGDWILLTLVDNAGKVARAMVASASANFVPNHGGNFDFLDQKDMKSEEESQGIHYISLGYWRGWLAQSMGAYQLYDTNLNSSCIIPKVEN